MSLTCLYVKAAMASEYQFIIPFESAFACHQDLHADQNFKVTRDLTVPANDEWNK